MAVVIEVAQASLKYWRPEDEASESKIFLEVYVEHRKPSVFNQLVRCKPCRRACRKKKKDKYSRCKTHPVSEAREMMWWQYTEDGFSIALFNLGGACSRMRHDDQVDLAADVFRRSIKDAGPTKVHTLRGTFRVGSWGMVSLRTPGVPLDTSGHPEVILELRPQSTRPFNLEFARPRQEWETIEDLFINRYAQPIWMEGNASNNLSTRDYLSIGFRTTASILRAFDSLASSGRGQQFSIRGSLKDSFGARFRGLFGRRKRTSQNSQQQALDGAQTAGGPELMAEARASGDRATEEKVNGGSEKPHMDVMYTSEGTESSTSPRAHKPKNQFKILKMMTSTVSDGGKRFGQAGSLASTDPGSINRKLQILVGQKVAKLKQETGKGAKAPSASKTCNEWRPESMKEVWKSSWPGTSDLLPERVEVIPLMEAEFRKDCIVLFNTLFPRVHSDAFFLLRGMALDGVSKMQWRIVRSCRPPAAQRQSLTGASDDDGGMGLRSSLSTRSLSSGADSPPIKGGPSRRGSTDTNLSSSSVETDVAEVNLSVGSITLSESERQEFYPITPASQPRSQPRWYWAPIRALKRAALGLFRLRLLRRGRYHRTLSPDAPHIGEVSQALSGSALSRQTSPGIMSPDTDSIDAAHSDFSDVAMEERVARPKATELATESITDSHFLGLDEQGESQSTSDLRKLIMDARHPGPSASKGFGSAQRPQQERKPIPDSAIAVDESQSSPGNSPREKGAVRLADRVSYRNCDEDGDAMMPPVDPAASYSTTATNLKSSGVAHFHGLTGAESRETASVSSCSTASLDSFHQPRSPSKSQTTLAAAASSNSAAFAHDAPVFSVMAKYGVMVRDEYSPRIMFLKRLLIVFAVCGVYYTEDGNSRQLGDLWPYPIAAILGHGARVLVCLEDIEGSEFINFLLFGDPCRVDWRIHGVPHPLVRRIAATHAVAIEGETGHLIEKKLKVLNAADSVQNISDGIRKKHLGINLPIGGVGNMSPLGKDHIIGFSGKVIRKTEEKKESLVVRMVSSKSKLAAKRQSRQMQAMQEQAALACSLTTDAVDAAPMARVPNSIRSASSTRSSTTLRTVSSMRSNGSEVAKKDDLFRPVANVQHGHLYMRIDDFGEQYIRPCWLKANRTQMSKHEEARRRLRSGEPVDLHAEPFSIHAGDLMLRNSAVAHRFAQGHSTYDPQKRLPSCDGNSGPRLIRVSSEPNVDRRAQLVSQKDKAWVEASFNSPCGQDLHVPPSAEALRLLLERVDPLSTRLYGTGQFKSIEDFHNELQTTRSYLMIKTKVLRCVVEKVVLKLKWKGQTLLQTHEIDEKNTNTSKRSLLTTSLKSGDDMLLKVRELVVGLGVDQDTVREAWDRIKWRSEDTEDSVASTRSLSRNQTYTCHEQKVASSRYPGIMSVHATHLVTWDVSRESEGLWRTLGLPVSEKSRAHNVNNADIIAARETSAGFRVHCWRWVSEADLHAELGRFDMSGVHDDPALIKQDQWVRYALEKEGELQRPPNEDALLDLFRKCGIAAHSDPTGKVIRSLWHDLTSQECFLQMSAGRPVRVVEAMLVRVRWRSSKAHAWQLLVQTDSESLEKLRPSKVNPFYIDDPQSPKVKSGKQLLRTRKYKDEKWEECALRCIQERVNLNTQQVRAILDHKPGDPSAYTFYEQQREKKGYQGLQTLYRTHLVTYTLKEDAGHTVTGRFILGISDVARSMSGYRRSSTGSSHRLGANTKRPAGMELSPETTDFVPPEASLAPGRTLTATSEWARSTFEWCLEDEALQIVAGGTLWAEASKKLQRRRVSSVLLGLEGAAPNFKSPFGGSHDASGEPNKVSALGGRKWRAYRQNNARQIPADEGGMRIQLTRRMMSELIDTCHVLDLLDPVSDITNEGVMSRDLINQRYAEQELFKQILMGSGRQAKKVVEDMLDYRNQSTTLGQAFSRMHDLIQRR